MSQEEINIEWEHPDISKIEHRVVNKELELKRVLINLILLLVTKLVLNVAKLVLFKLDYTVDYSTLNKLRIALQLLFAWNIVSGLYRVFKPQDDFKDLKLNNQQRELLGLKEIPITEPDQVAKPAQVINTTPLNSPKTKKQQGTPIASPMSSQPLPQLLSPHKASPLRHEQATDLNKAKDPITSLKITPTYIPSPKYYYRMDSPTKSRRRV